MRVCKYLLDIRVLTSSVKCAILCIYTLCLGACDEFHAQAQETGHSWRRRERAHVPGEGWGGPQNGPEDRGGVLHNRPFDIITWAKVGIK